MTSLVLSILCLVYKIDIYFNLSTLVTSSGRSVKRSVSQWLLSAWQSVQRVGREQRASLSTLCLKKGLATAVEQVAVSLARAKWGSQDYINLLFPNQLLQGNYHRHDGLDHLIQLDGSSGGWVNKGSQESCGLYWPGAAASQALNALLDLLLGTDRANKTHASHTRGVQLQAKYLPSEVKRVEMAVVAISSLPCAPLRTNKRFLIHKNNSKEEER